MKEYGIPATGTVFRTVQDLMMTEGDLTHLPLDKESGTIEFKTSFGAEVIETLVAFANTRGGSVYVGIADDGSVSGLNLSPETVQQWINEIKTKTSPMIIPDAEVHQLYGLKVVVFRLQEYPIKPVSFRGKYFKRVGNSNHLMATAEVVDTHLQTFNTSWDYRLAHQFGMNDISLDKVQLAIEKVSLKRDKADADDPFTFLLKHDLVRNGAVTHAAYLLFAKRPSLFTTIELGRFQTDILIKDTDRSKSDILSQVDEVLEFVKKHINKEIIITGQVYNTQRWQYPLEAIREIIHNMVIHRDYRSASDSIVKIYDHKIEFYNPGRLPDSISEKDLMTNAYKSTPRNKLLADFCRHIGMIEKYGSGIQRIINYFKTSGLPLPSFENISEGFQVTVFDGHANDNSNNVVENVVNNVVEDVVDNETRILRLLHAEKQLSAKKIAVKLNIAPRTAQRYLSHMINKNMLKRTGPPRGGYWEVL